MDNEKPPVSVVLLLMVMLSLGIAGLTRSGVVFWAIFICVLDIVLCGFLLITALLDFQKK